MDQKILVVDDEACNRLLFCSILRKAGLDAREAPSYHEALSKILDENFDLVICDIFLDGHNGTELLRQIKERQPTCPVVMVTASPSLDSATEAVRLGAYDYLAKPVEKVDLLRVCRSALKFKRLADQQKETQINLEAIFRSVNDAIVTVDARLNVLAINEAARRICGYAKEAIGSSVDADQPCRKDCLKALKKAMDDECVIVSENIRCDCQGRPDQVVSLTSSPLYNAHGSCYGAVLVIRDNTRLHSLERTLKQVSRFHRIVGSSSQMQAIYSLIERLADVPTTVLVTGESGTGKELVAEALHKAGSRKGPLIKVNCAALSENLLESELFGHVKGAFTGAVKDKTGRFMAADGGTIFLDEIGDISPGMQTRLLRVLQEKVVERVGDIKAVPVDVRVVAATNRDLKARIESGHFREDLFFRLRVVNIDLPPLRTRKTDIPELVEHLIGKLNLKLNRVVRDVSPAVMKIFMAHSWPGNIRELEHCLEHAFILCQGERIDTEHLPADVNDSTISTGQPSPALTDLDLEAIQAALARTDGNKAKAARLLGISRRTIYRKLEEFNTTHY